jgi:putative transcriptional regulator
MKLGNNLRRLRFEAGEMSQEALASRVEVTRQTIISIEKNRFVPSAFLALRLATALQKSFEEVFFLIDEDTDSEL